MTSSHRSALTALPQFRTATHVISGFQLARSGVRLVNLRDNFAFGPSGVDCVGHMVARRGYWRAASAATGKARAHAPLWRQINRGFIHLRAALPTAEKLVFWTTPSLRETVQLAQTLTIASEMGVDLSRCRVARVNSARPSLPIESSTHAEMIDPFLIREPLSVGRMNSLVQLWASFADDRPAQTLDLLRGSSSAAAEEYLLAFPRVTPTGWAASALDAAILNALAIDEWVPGEVLMNDDGVDERWVRRGGQWALWLRVSAMIATKAAAIAVEQSDGSQPPWKVRYRLTRVGRSLRAGCIPQAGQLPSHEIGGHRVDSFRPAWLVGPGGSLVQQVHG